MSVYFKDVQLRVADYVLISYKNGTDYNIVYFTITHNVSVPARANAVSVPRGTFNSSQGEERVLLGNFFFLQYPPGSGRGHNVEISRFLESMRSELKPRIVSNQQNPSIPRPDPCQKPTPYMLNRNEVTCESAE